MGNGHLTSAVFITDPEGNPLGWYPYCATCNTAGARCRDEVTAEQVADAHAHPRDTPTDDAQGDRDG